MKSQIMFVVFSALLAMATVHAGADEKSVKTKESVQASVDKPDPTRKGSVTGTVVDEKGKAVDGVKVELTDTVLKEKPLSVITDKKGQYAFSRLFPGTYRIQATKEKMQSDSVDINIANQPNTGPKLILKAARM